MSDASEALAAREIARRTGSDPEKLRAALSKGQVRPWAMKEILQVLIDQQIDRRVTYGPQPNDQPRGPSIGRLDPAAWNAEPWPTGSNGEYLTPAQVEWINNPPNAHSATEAIAYLAGTFAYGVGHGRLPNADDEEAGALFARDIDAIADLLTVGLLAGSLGRRTPSEDSRMTSNRGVPRAPMEPYGPNVAIASNPTAATRPLPHSPAAVKATPSTPATENRSQTVRGTRRPPKGRPGALSPATKPATAVAPSGPIVDPRMLDQKDRDFWARLPNISDHAPVVADNDNATLAAEATRPQQPSRTRPTGPARKNKPANNSSRAPQQHRGKPPSRYDLGKALGRRANAAVREAIRDIIGRVFPPEFRQIWDEIAERYVARNREVARLWNSSNPADRARAVELANDLYSNKVKPLFYETVRARGLGFKFEACLLELPVNPKNSPFWRLPEGRIIYLTIDHMTRQSDNPTKAITGSNLQFVTGWENSVMLEFIRNKDIFGKVHDTLQTATPANDNAPRR